MPKCKLHPKYKGIRRPTSEREGCRCWSVYNQAEGARQYAEYLKYRKQKDAHDAVYTDPFESRP